MLVSWYQVLLKVGLDRQRRQSKCGDCSLLLDRHVGIILVEVTKDIRKD